MLSKYRRSITCWTPRSVDVQSWADIVFQNWRSFVLVRKRKNTLFTRFGHAGWKKHNYLFTYTFANCKKMNTVLPSFINVFLVYFGLFCLVGEQNIFGYTFRLSVNDFCNKSGNKKNIFRRPNLVVFFTVPHF